MNAECLKCGQNDIYTRFRKKDEYLSDIFSERELSGQAKKDCLYRKCRTCGHWWIERTHEETLIDNFGVRLK